MALLQMALLLEDVFAHRLSRTMGSLARAKAMFSRAIGDRSRGMAIVKNPFGEEILMDKERACVGKARRHLNFRLKGTIIHKITPLVLTLALLKGAIWFLEAGGWWFEIENLGILFTIIGFALGIILSQKIGTTYDKYRTLDETMFLIQGKLTSMESFLNGLKAGYGSTHIKRWLKTFLETYHGKDEHGARTIRKADDELYAAVMKLGNETMIPHHRLAALLKEIFVDATFILGKKASYTPKEYDKLLQQVTLIYLFLIVIFIPGANGLVSVVLAAYLLYGMYYVTQDLDLSIGDGKTSLITLKPRRLENYYREIPSAKERATKNIVKHPRSKHPL